MDTGRLSRLFLIISIVSIALCVIALWKVLASP